MVSRKERQVAYTLPELDYDYAALEPHISARIMELHHSKHHKAYVDGANAAVTKLEELRESGDYAALNGVEKNLAFHLGGHTNHSVFWKNMSPDGGASPTVRSPRRSPSTSVASTSSRRTSTRTPTRS